MFEVADRHWWRLATVLVVVPALLALTACQTSPQESSGTAGVPDLRLIKSSTSLSALPLLYAMAAKLFNGINVVDAPTSVTSTAPIQALLTGQTDVVQVGSTTATFDRIYDVSYLGRQQ